MDPVADFPRLELPPSTSHDDRNRLTLRRTLSAISWIHAGWTGLLGLLAQSVSGPHSFHPGLLLGHAGLFALAGWALWRPRRGAVAATLLAALGGVAFVVLDVRQGHPQGAAVDAIYPVVAVALLTLSRPRP